MANSAATRKKKACWGCDHDYLYTSDRLTEADLLEVKIYGAQELVCPDCYDEIPEDATDL